MSGIAVFEVFDLPRLVRGVPKDSERRGEEEEEETPKDSERRGEEEEEETPKDSERRGEEETPKDSERRGEEEETPRDSERRGEEETNLVNGSARTEALPLHHSITPFFLTHSRTSPTRHPTSPWRHRGLLCRLWH